MRTLIDWLKRLEASGTGELGLSYFRLWVPGFTPLALSDWIMHSEPHEQPRQTVQGSSPLAHSILRILDVPSRPPNVYERHRLGAELAGILTLALGRRAEVAHEIMISIPQLQRTTHMPFTQTVDRTVLGPLPDNPRDGIDAVLRVMLGLPDDDVDVIGAALSVYHSAVLLFDRDVRAAYALLISGVEVLSRQYGAPPTSWTDWDQRASWDALLAEIEAGPAQAAAIRQRLLQDKQLRLKATFRNYAASRLPSGFWDSSWQEWSYGVNVNENIWLPAEADAAKAIRDLFPEDRDALSKALGKSYDLRSAFVHRGDWLELLSLSTKVQTPVDLDEPLPFSVLRAILGALILTEAQARSTPRAVPAIRILGPVEGAAAQ